MLFITNALIAALLGAFVGKFLAMAVDFLPKILLEENDETKEPSDIFKWFFQKPRCLYCQRSIPWLDNVPIFGYLSLKGKCRLCKHPLGIKVLLFELGTAFLFGGSTLFFSFNYALILVLVVSCILICCFMTDFEHGILPDQFTITIVWIGMIGSLFPIFVTPYEAIVGAVGGYGIFWLFNVLYHYSRGFDGMYPGDFKLNAGIGACVGLNWLIIILLMSILLLLVVTVAQLFYGMRAINKNLLHQEAPYGCYASVVAVIVLYVLLSRTLV